MIKQANILAGGYASRMGSTNLPKSLLPISKNGKPIIGFVLDMLLKSGISDLIVTIPSAGTNAAWAELIRTYTVDSYGDKFSKITFIEAGASIKESIIKTKPFYDDDFLLLAGDIFTDADLTELSRTHLQNNIFSLVAVFKDKDTRHHGVIIRNKASIKFIPKNSHTYDEGLVDAAIYAISKDFIGLLENNEAYHEAIIKAFESGKASVHEHGGYCHDINTDEKYVEVCEFVRQLEAD